MMAEQRPATCKKCGAALVWASGILKDGTRGSIPMNKQRVRAYELSIDDLGPPEFLAVERNGKTLLVYVSHFTTCPNASEFSRGKRKT